MSKLTAEQIQNWRDILRGMVGPYADLMSEEQVQDYRDRMQAIADATASENSHE